jgi:cytidylate kinase
MPELVVAVDGPSGSGKSTVSRLLAHRLGARYLDTGAMYRAVTLAVLRAGVDPGEADAVAKIATDIDIAVGTDPHETHTAVDGQPVDNEIRGAAVTAAVSAVAAVPEVRRILVARQRQIIAETARIVVVKVYLTASADERARRRSAEDAADMVSTAADLARRDRFDSTRAADPLQQAPDAIVLDTTELGIDEVVSRLVHLLGTRS